MLLESRIAEEHFTHSTVALRFHPAGVFRHSFQYAPLFLVGGSPPVGAKAAALGQMEENAGKLRTAYGFIQRAGAQSINVLQDSDKKAFQLFGSEQATGEKQAANPFISVPVPSQPPPGAAGFPARRGKGSTGFRLFGGIENPGTHIKNPTGVFSTVQSKRRPADGRDTNVKTNRISAHGSPPFVIF